MLNRRNTQAGLSVVELMVGIAVGLLVLAGATLLMSTQLAENRKLLVETQLQQDMRASMDIITRELRRIGAQNEPLALAGIAQPGGSGAQENIWANSPTATVVGTQVNNIEFRYMPGTNPDGPFGFRVSTGGVLQSQMATLGWQDLTDGSVLLVRSFGITPRHGAPVRLPCPKPCPTGGATDCWPQVQMREFEVTLTASPTSDLSVLRTLNSKVRVRNDYVRFNTGTSDICPA